MFKGVTNGALIILIKRYVEKMFLLLIHIRQALNNLMYAVGKRVSPSFIEKECYFGVMHKNMLKISCFVKLIQYIFLLI